MIQEQVQQAGLRGRAGAGVGHGPEPAERWQ
jgi:NADH:ubiquinone oxidoreductase subunit F (NADH-binding)